MTIGEILTCNIAGAAEYDLFGELIYALCKTRDKQARNDGFVKSGAGNARKSRGMQ